MYSEDWSGHMPPTVKLHSHPDFPIQPQELMASYHVDEGLDDTSTGGGGGGTYMPVAQQSKQPHSPFKQPLPEHLRGWDGLGLLHPMQYCRATECYYCPSHTGDHPIERYTSHWQSPGKETIYINYHYAGHINWETRRRRAFRFSSSFVIASDGLRTVSDFNHGTGMNILFGDGSVEHHGDALTIYQMLPEDQLAGAPQEELYKVIWSEIERGVGGYGTPNPPGGN